jgi:magnesium transporter
MGMCACCRGQYLLVLDHDCNGKHGQSKNHLERSTQNRELLQLMRIEKSLVYFRAVLRANATMLEVELNFLR